MRATHLAANPRCTHVDTETQAQCTEPATDVDHIIPHRGEDALRLDPNNLRSYCHRHHSSKTARQDGGFGNTRYA